MAQKLKNLSITRVALVPAGSNPLADVVLLKKKPEQPKEPVSMKLKKSIDKSKLSTEDQTALDALLQKCSTDLPDAAPGPEDEDDKIVKSLPPEAQAILKKAQEDAATARKDAERATEIAVMEKSLREEHDGVLALTPLVKAFPGDNKANATLMYRVKKALKEADFTALETLIKAGAAALASVTAEIGVVGAGVESSIGAELTELAKKRQVEKGIPYSDAYSEIITENAEKVAQLRKEQARARRRDQDGDDEDNNN